MKTVTVLLEHLPICWLCSSTVWSTRLYINSYWHQIDSCISGYGVYNVTELLFPCQQKVVYNLMEHPVRYIWKSWSWIRWIWSDFCSLLTIFSMPKKSDASLETALTHDVVDFATTFSQRHKVSTQPKVHFRLSRHQGYSQIQTLTFEQWPTKQSMIKTYVLAEMSKMFRKFWATKYQILYLWAFIERSRNSILSRIGVAPCHRQILDVKSLG